MGLLMVIVNIIDPFKIMRNLILWPIIDMVSTILDHYKNRTKDGVTSAKDIILRISVIAFATALIIWTSIFMYVAFYYTYMPTTAHVRPVHLQFSPCDDVRGPCSFPAAHVSLTKKQQLLMIGQQYRVALNIDMPESPQNEANGMFMVCAQMIDQSATLRAHSCRSAILHYKSRLLKILHTIFMSPSLVFNFREQRQQIIVELFSNYEDDQFHPVTDVFVEIQSKYVQFYGVTLQITAHFTGLRYIMFNWPLMSAAFGISTNLFLLLIICVLSWYHWSDTSWFDDAREKYKNLRKSSKSDKDEDTSIESSQNLLDDFKEDEEEEDDISMVGDINISSKIEELSSSDIRERKKPQQQQYSTESDC